MKIQDQTTESTIKVSVVAQKRSIAISASSILIAGDAIMADLRLAIGVRENIDGRFWIAPLVLIQIDTHAGVRQGKALSSAAEVHQGVEDIARTVLRVVKVHFVMSLPGLDGTRDCSAYDVSLLLKVCPVKRYYRRRGQKGP